MRALSFMVIDIIHTCIKEPCYKVAGLCNMSGLFHVAGLFDIVCCTRFFMSHLGKKTQHSMYFTNYYIIFVLS